MITAETLVAREVYYCVSSLVSTLASDMSELAEPAFALVRPIEDYEEAAIDAILGWSFSHLFAECTKRDLDVGDNVEQSTMRSILISNLKESGTTYFEEFCWANDIEPYEREVYEHWIVSDWLADKLAEKGEKVDKDFAGLTVWARTTTGQGIASDWVIEQIVAELNA
jgi:hypothetical protein